MITIDGTQYNVGVHDLKRKATIIEGPNAGFSLNHTKILDVIGTLTEYSCTIDVSGMGVADYDALYQALTDPATMPHTVIMPDGQTVRVSQYYGLDISDALICEIDNKRWGSLAVTFTEMTPGRTA